MTESQQLGAKVFAHKIALSALMIEMGLTQKQLTSIGMRADETLIALMTRIDDRAVLDTIQDELNSLFAAAGRKCRSLALLLFVDAAFHSVCRAGRDVRST
jgi:hypothetical protein